MYRTPGSLAVAALLASTLLLPSTAHSQVLSPASVSYEGYNDLRTAENDTTYMRGLTHRYVNGELRFLSLTHKGVLHEFRLGSLGSGIETTTATWNLSSTGAISDFNGIWYEQAKNRLWITGSIDYTAENHPAKVTLVTLGSGGSASVSKVFYLNVPAKRVYGGCQAVPASLVSQLGGPYVCGWGGYTSLLLNGGGASIGATMYAIPDPDSIGNGSTVQARTVLDHFGSRGVRRTFPENNYDTGNWMSPNNEGSGWMVWGDSYYNTGMWIGTSYVAVASLCQGSCWYEDSTLNHDGRQFELHIWNGSALGQNNTQRPASMTELNLPRGNSVVWKGNVTAGNISGATYDPTSGRLYMVGYPLGTGATVGRLYTFRVNAGSQPPPPPPAQDTQAPSVSISSPSNNAAVTGTVNLTATASDNVGVTSVWFSVDSVTVGAEDSTAPYQTSWNTSSVGNGTHAVRAMARDAAGHVTTSSVVSVTVNNPVADTTAPSVSLNAPGANTTVSGTVPVSASASDNVGVTSVQFTLNNINLGAADTSAPYSINWSTTGAANGTHQLRAVARDAAGNTTTSSVRTVTVSNQSADTTGPSVSLTGPSAGSTVSGVVTVSASASDNVGVASVQFRLNGVNLGAADSSAPYAINWSTTGAGNGTHVLQAVASDTSGNTTTSATRTVTVNNAAPAPPPPPPPPPPTTAPPATGDTSSPWISLTGPSTRRSQRGVVDITANAFDNVGVSSVQFTVDGTNVGSPVTAAPYVLSWNTATVSNGSHRIEAIARDAAGNTRTSSARVITVSNSSSAQEEARVKVRGDLNGDRRPDLLFQHSSGQLHTWFMDGPRMIGDRALSPGSVSPLWTAASLDDFNDDGKSDVLWQHQQTGQLYVWHLDGADMIEESTIGSGSTPWRVSTTGDLNGDGSTDIVWQHPVSGAMKVWLMKGRSISVEAGLSPYRADINWKVVGAADLNRDGRDDLVWQNRQTGQLSVWQMAADGRTAAIAMGLSPWFASPLWIIKAVADFDGDGSPDIIWQHAQTSQLYVWYLDGARMVRSEFLRPGQVDAAWQIIGGR